MAQVTDKTVQFTDGSTEEVDAIIFATGYELSLPYLYPTAHAALAPDADQADLYHHTFHPGMPGFALVGVFHQSGTFTFRRLNCRRGGWRTLERAPLTVPDARRDDGTIAATRPPQRPAADAAHAYLGATAGRPGGRGACPGALAGADEGATLWPPVAGLLPTGRAGCTARRGAVGAGRCGRLWGYSGWHAHRRRADAARCACSSGEISETQND
ncbi:MAG: hypothetical protein H6573_30065 [Lewinellaceae bacterium]|nr:hypothetical protein [Lewinellaceae bacterium]